MTKFYNEPKNKLPRATGMEPVALNLHNFNKECKRWVPIFNKKNQHVHINIYQKVEE